MNVLEIDNVTFAYDDFRGQKGDDILQKVSFTVGQGESVGLIGANGVGKSTLLKLLCGLLPLQQGRVTIIGKDLQKNHLKAIREQVGYVFQDSDSQLFMTTIYEDVAFGPRNYGKSREEVESLVMNALRQVHIEHLREKQVYRLSGGEKKLASIATILAMPTQLILLDEPTVALDPKNRRNLINVLNELPQAKLVASHDLDFIYDTCSKVILLSGKGVAQIGPAETLLRDRSLLEEHGLELPLSFIHR